jgi:hypothetical protein
MFRSYDHLQAEARSVGIVRSLTQATELVCYFRNCSVIKGNSSYIYFILPLETSHNLEGLVHCLSPPPISTPWLTNFIVL